MSHLKKDPAEPAVPEGTNSTVRTPMFSSRASRWKLSLPAILYLHTADFRLQSQDPTISSTAATWCLLLIIPFSYDMGREFSFSIPDWYQSKKKFLKTPIKTRTLHHCLYRGALRLSFTGFAVRLRGGAQEIIERLESG
jgi:hypothetical protein